MEMLMHTYIKRTKTQASTSEEAYRWLEASVSKSTSKSDNNPWPLTSEEDGA